MRTLFDLIYTTSSILEKKRDISHYEDASDKLPGSSSQVKDGNFQVIALSLFGEVMVEPTKILTERS